MGSRGVSNYSKFNCLRIVSLNDLAKAALKELEERLVSYRSKVSTLRKLALILWRLTPERLKVLQTKVTKARARFQRSQLKFLPRPDQGQPRFTSLAWRNRLNASCAIVSERIHCRGHIPRFHVILVWVVKNKSPFIYTALLFCLLAFANIGNNSSGFDLPGAFLRGELHVGTAPVGDTSPYGGKVYLPYGPLPFVLMMPLFAIGQPHLGLVLFATTLSMFTLCYLLARRFDYSADHACWFALAYCFGTSYIGVAAVVWGSFFHNSLVGVFLFLAILECEKARRYWLIGAWIGLAAATRQPAVLNVSFFALSILFAATASLRRKASDLAQLGIGLNVFVGLLALYNYARFGNPLESGYGLQVFGADLKPYSDVEIPGNQSGPALSLAHIPANLSVFLFGLPEVRAIGASVFLVSPYLVYLTRVKWDLTAKLIAVNVAVVLLALLSFRSTGFEQMGYRFSLDFLPFVFWLLIRSRVPMTPVFKALIVTATILDIALVAYFLATGVERCALT